jgi:hypothetical protein
MQISPQVPILCLLAGALLFELGALVRFRWLGLIVVVATGAATVAMLLLGRGLPATSVVLDWRPVTVFGSTASLRVDETAWLLGVALLLTGFSVTLVWLAVPGQQPFAARGLTLAMMAVGLASLFAANILTLALCWGMLDALFCLTLLTQGGSASGRRAQLALGVNGLATLAMWVVVVLIEQDRVSPYWHLMILPPTARVLMGLAAALRLGLYPLHIWQPVELESEPDRSILIYLVPAIAGLSLWTRLAVIQGLLEGNVWPTIALVTALIGGVLAWIQSDPRQSLPYLALGYGGVLILTAVAGKVPAAVLAAGSASWLLGLTALFVGRSWARGVGGLLWAIPAALGAATLAGLPMTLGFGSRTALYQAASGGPGWVFILGMVAEVLLIGAMLRRLLTPDASLLPAGTFARAGYAAALAVIAAPIVIGGWVPSSLTVPATSVAAWVGWGLPLALAVALAATAGRLRLLLRLDSWKDVAGQILRLDWLYSFVLGVARGLARASLWLTDVLEGDGAFLWMLLILALVLLYLRGSLGW